MIDKSSLDGLSPSSSAAEILSSNLLEGLHAAAQPLTILRATLDIGQLDGMSMDEFRRLAATSAAEVERVCMIFSCLKDLVSTYSTKPDLSAKPILPILAHVADGFNLLFEGDGMFLRSTVPDTCYPVLIDKVRAVQAFSSVLMIAHAVSRRPDTVELIVSSSPSNAVRVVVQNLNSNLKSISAEASLNMALAESKIRSQQATFTWSLKPFTVQIDFQKTRTMDS